MHVSDSSPPRRSGGSINFVGRLARHAAAAASAVIAATMALATPAQAQAFYASSYDATGANYFYQLQSNGAGADVLELGRVYNGPNSSIDDGLRFNAMAVVNGQMKAIGLSANLNYNRYTDVTPKASGGAYTSNAGALTLSNGDVFGVPIRTMATLGGQVLAVGQVPGMNILVELNQQPGTSGAVAGAAGGVRLGQNGGYFAYQIETLAEFGGQLYGTAFTGTENLLFKVNWDSAGSGAWVDAASIGTLTFGVGGAGDPRHVDAMVGGPDGLYGTTWNDVGNYNTFFRITPGSAGGYETDIGAVMLEGYALNHRINALGYVPGGAVTPGAVPEPATWMLMIVGFGAIGATVRAKRQDKAATA